ncbi:MAG: hypothetical protein KJ574_00840 [Nanoarchaeota archaeon]|nr:hypothetical protein [Nanoarchaeota archaeon]
MSFLLKHWDYFIRSFKDKRVLNILIYEGLFFIALFVIWILLQSYIGTLAEKARMLTPISLDTQIMTPTDELNFVSAVKIQLGYVLSATVALVLFFLAFLSTRFAIYSKLLGKHRKWGFFGKSILVSILAGFVAFLVSYLFQALLFFIFAGSLGSRFSQSVMFLLFVVFFSIVSYFLVNFKLRLFREQSFIKGTRSFFEDNIKGIRHFLLPMTHAAIIFIIINIITFFLLFIPGRTLFLIIFTVILVLYFAWMRVYYLILMEPSARKKAKRH